MLIVTSVLGQFSLSSLLLLKRYIFCGSVLSESFIFLGFTKILLTSSLKLDANSQMYCKVRESITSFINWITALFAGEGSCRSFVVPDFLGLAGLLVAATHLRLLVIIAELDAVLRMLTGFTRSSEKDSVCFEERIRFW